MRKTISVLLFFLLCLNSLVAQSRKVIVVKENEAQPYSLGPGEPAARTRGFVAKPSVRPDAYTVQYINVSPGPNGAIQGLTRETVYDQKLIGEFNFPSLYLTASVAAKIITENLQETGKIEGGFRTRTELNQMCLNLKLVPLDEDQKEIEEITKPISSDPGFDSDFIQEFGKEPLLILGITPYESAFSREPSATARLGQAVSFLNPLGTVALGASAIFSVFSPTQNVPNQISYISSGTEFGWIWREHENYGIEGIHLGAALLRTHKSVKNILVKIELIADWKRFGAWLKAIEYIVPVNADTIPAK